MFTITFANPKGGSGKSTLINALIGTQIAIVIREKLMKAEVVKLPFIQQK